MGFSRSLRLHSQLLAAHLSATVVVRDDVVALIVGLWQGADPGNRRRRGAGGAGVRGAAAAGTQKSVDGAVLSNSRSSADHPLAGFASAFLPAAGSAACARKERSDWGSSEWTRPRPSIAFRARRAELRREVCRARERADFFEQVVGSKRIPMPFKDSA